MAHNQPYAGFPTISDSDESLQPPRRPNPETERRLRLGTIASGSATQPMMRKTLSADAPIFVPRHGGMSQTSQSCPPAGLLSPGAAEFFPRTDYSSVPPNVTPNMGPLLQMAPTTHDSAVTEGFSQMSLTSRANPYQGAGNQFSSGPSQYMDVSKHYTGIGSQFADIADAELTEYLLREFINTMVILTTLPGNIRDYLSPLCDKLRQAKSPDILQLIIDSLYVQSVHEPNFRYTGARVVHFLCNNLKNHPIFVQFKQNFMNKCQQDYNNREKLLKSGPESLSTLCGLTLFMGELFLNVTIGSDRLEFLPEALTQLILTLLSEPSDVTVKTSCQLLKLAGGDTEDSMKKSPHSQQFNNIFTSLHNLQSAQNLLPNTKLLMKSVLNLRESNWGRPDARPVSTVECQNRPSHPEETHNSSASQPHGEFQQPEPVFYDQHGKPISREEAGYSQEEEEEEENPDGYVLTEEEERDYLQWQEEKSIHEEQLTSSQPQGVNPNGQVFYADGYQDMRYLPWSTADSSLSNFNNYPQNYNYNYSGCPDEEGLAMDEEAERAYEEFLSSQKGHQ